MPPEVKEKAPQKASFQSGLISNENLADTLNAPQNNALITKGRSFMDSGENAYTDEQQQQREETAQGARATLLVRMQRENQQSRIDAADMEEKHRLHKENEMDPAINHAREKVKAAHFAKADYLIALSKTGRTNADQALQELNSFRNEVGAGDNAINAKMQSAQNSITRHRDNPRNKFLRAVSFASASKNSARRAYNNATDAAFNAATHIRAASNRWDEMLSEYREGTYKVHSKNYDRLFQSYYMLSRGKEMTKEGEGVNFKKTDDAGANDQNANAKDIVEYTGRYVEPGSWFTKVHANPYQTELSRIEAGKGTSENSNNFMDGKLKHHTMVTLEAFGQNANGEQVHTLGEEQAGEEPVRRVRFKIDNTFKGYKAKNQINVQGQLEDSGAPNKDVDHRIGMGNMNLVADEKGVNGEYIFSQKSAKIYNAKSKNNSQRTNGFYIGGEFISANKDVMTDQQEQTYFSSPNFKKIQQDERLRAAIRRSDFFRHINKATIQLYMNYDDTTQEISDQNVKRDFMSKRDGLFSWTSLGQNLLDGTLLGTLGGLATTTLSGIKTWEDIPDDKINNLYVKYADVAMKSANTKEKIPGTKDKGYVFGGLSLAATAIMPASAIFGAAETGAKTSLAAHTVISMLKNISQFVGAIKNMKKRHVGDSKIPFIVTMGEAILDFLASAATFIDYFADKALSDQVKGWAGGVKDAILGLKDIVDLIIAGVEKSGISKSDAKLKTVMSAVKGTLPGASNEQVAEGQALQNNTQASAFLKLARARANKDQWKSGFGAVSKGLNSAASFVGMGDKTAWFNPLSLPFKLASKVVSFLGMGWNKILGASRRADNVEMMLGDRKLDGTPHFDEILKEETGINNRHYISELARVFTAIDTHCLLHKSVQGGDPGGFALAKDVVSTYYKKKDTETDEEFVRRISFNRLLKAVGAPKGWRSVLMESVS